MIENELIQIWQSSPKHERIKFEKSKLMLDVQSSLDRLDRAIRFRDFIEIGAAIFVVIPIFGYQIYNQPNILAKFGAVWIVVYCLYVIYKLLNVKKSKPEESGSYMEYLKQSKTYLERQKSLLDSVVYWYILPSLPGVIIMVTGILELYRKSWKEVIGIKHLWILLLLIIAITIFAYLMNKRAVKKELVPRLKKVDELIRLMEED
ncbi:hypothetical protein [Flagellimonas flava]|uniref:hypothetical protein n=1 Tax=Flagellimonas flava TaxID=570519 RepID=UPI003D649681